VKDPDLEWGQYVLLRPWDEKKFLASLRSAERVPVSELNRDGNRAVMYCTTTDPYQAIRLIHTPFAFQPGDEQDPRDENGKVIYDDGVTLQDTWGALESLVDEGRCKAIGLSDVNLEKAKGIFESARIKPAVVHVESHPYLPEWELLEFCNKNGIVLQAFAALGHCGVGS
jgi:diketogulonate reductase-like aldo/keto reductase